MVTRRSLIIREKVHLKSATDNRSPQVYDPYSLPSLGFRCVPCQAGSGAARCLFRQRLLIVLLWFMHSRQGGIPYQRPFPWLDAYLLMKVATRAATLNCLRVVSREHMIVSPNSHFSERCDIPL